MTFVSSATLRFVALLVFFCAWPMLLLAQSSPEPPIETVEYFEPPDEEEIVEVGQITFFGDWLGYNSTMSDTTWIPESGDGLGIFSIETFPVKKLGESASLTSSLNFHFLNGPVSTDLPPRLFDFRLGMHTRPWVSDHSMISLAYSLGWYSDFEGSAREGLRFPGHLVFYAEDEDGDAGIVLGIEVLDRDDIKLLPVAGLILHDSDVAYELVFPRPKIQIATSADSAWYISGELGGGTWAIERDTLTNDNVTYRDTRITCGWIGYGGTSSGSLEVGYVFNRSLEYRSQVGNYKPEDAFIFRIRTHY